MSLIMKIDEITHLLNYRKFEFPDQIREVFSSLKDVCLIPSLILSQGTKLYRARVINNVEEISKTSDLSYTPPCFNKSYKRASTPNNTMFYGVSGDSHSDRICGCLSEVCECFRIPNMPNKHYKVVVGIWESTKNFILPQIINPDGNNKSEAFGNISEYLQHLYMLGYKAPEIMDFQRLLNYEFTKHVKTEKEYWISAIFTEWLLSQKPSYDGVIYESVQSVDSKLVNNHCVAIKPQVADNYLQFQEALLYEFDYVGPNVEIYKPKTINIYT